MLELPLNDVTANFLKKCLVELFNVSKFKIFSGFISNP